MTVPGFQPWPVYEVALAGLAPELERDPRPDDAADALDWAGEPLAAAEVAALLDVPVREAREQLAAAGEESAVPGAAEGWWRPRERVREVAPRVAAA